ncbi:Polysaccharide biosynthesis protein [Flavobacteriaceae bacterium MAR_2010_188]|nr:Polysaccharide biosynthesis protein [Flavobacteriaceae bacterium MAR_2010_188]
MIKFIKHIFKNFNWKKSPGSTNIESLHENLTRNLNQKEIRKLLGREEFLLDVNQFKSELEFKTIMISGAAGTIGSGLSRILAEFNLKNLILIDNSESALYDLQQELINKRFLRIECIVSDVREITSMENIFQKYTPDFVFHAAAYKHVPLMEKFPSEAVGANVLGTKVIADLSNKYGIEKFILISSDKAVNPSNVMGATKRLSELYISSLNTKSNSKFISTRFSNILESNGSVIPLFKNQIKNGGPVLITHPQMGRFMMTNLEACNFIIQASSIGLGGETFVFKIGKEILITDLAFNLIKIFNLSKNDVIKTKYIGLRPGEKLHEEFVGKSERLITTYFENISVVKNTSALNYNRIEEKINELCNTYKGMNNLGIVSKIKEIVPEFVSINSSYEVLDSTLNAQKDN